MTMGLTVHEESKRAAAAVVDHPSRGGEKRARVHPRRPQHLIDLLPMHRLTVLLRRPVSSHQAERTTDRVPPGPQVARVRDERRRVCTSPNGRYPLREHLIRQCDALELVRIVGELTSESQLTVRVGSCPVQAARVCAGSDSDTEERGRTRHDEGVLVPDGELRDGLDLRGQLDECRLRELMHLGILVASLERRRVEPGLAQAPTLEGTHDVQRGIV